MKEALKKWGSECPCDMRGLPNRQERTVRQSKGHRWEVFRGEKGTEGGEFENCRRMPVQPVSAIRGEET